MLTTIPIKLRNNNKVELRIQMCILHKFMISNFIYKTIKEAIQANYYQRFLNHTWFIFSNLCSSKLVHYEIFQLNLI